MNLGLLVKCSMGVAMGLDQRKRMYGLYLGSNSMTLCRSTGYLQFNRLAPK